MNSLTIGQLAKRADVGVETVRFYERQGLLPDPNRRSSGYRQYDKGGFATRTLEILSDIALLLFVFGFALLGGGGGSNRKVEGLFTWARAGHRQDFTIDRTLRHAAITHPSTAEPRTAQAWPVA